MKIFNPLRNNAEQGGGILDLELQHPWKFGLTNSLERGAIALLPAETIIESWCYVSTRMSLDEWITTFLTFGIYYLITRVVLARKRAYAIYVTNKNVIVKEEMCQTWLGCETILMENQISYSIQTVTFLSAEEVDNRLCGLLPGGTSLNIRFCKYPVNSQMPKTIFKSLFFIITEPFITGTSSCADFFKISTNPV